MTQLDDLFATIRARWRALDIDQPGSEASDADVDAFQQRHDVRLSPDVREFFQKVGGMKDGGYDEDVLRFWPLSEVALRVRGLVNRCRLLQLSRNRNRRSSRCMGWRSDRARSALIFGSSSRLMSKGIPIVGGERRSHLAWAHHHHQTGARRLRLAVRSVAFLAHVTTPSATARSTPPQAAPARSAARWANRPSRQAVRGSAPSSTRDRPPVGHASMRQGSPHRSRAR
jgi:hypothetical protein